MFIDEYLPLLEGLEYRLIHHTIDPNLLLDVYEERHTFFMELVNLKYFAETSKTQEEKILLQRRGSEADNIFQKILNSKYPYDISIYLLATMRYAQINKKKDWEWLSVFSEEDYAFFDSFFDILFSAIHLIVDVLPAEQFIAFVSSLLSENKNQCCKFFQNKNTHYDETVIYSLLPYFELEESKKLVGEKVQKLIGITEEEWVKYKEIIREFSLTYYLYHQFTGTGNVRNLEVFTEFYDTAEEFWRKHTKVVFVY